MEGVQTNCLVGSCNRLGGTVPKSVHLFGLSITFGMISRSEVELHVQCSSEGLEEVGYEFHTTIGSDVARDTVLEKTCRTKSCASWGDVMVSWVGMKSDCFERQSTMTKNWGVTGRMRELLYEIHGYGIPRLLRNQKLLEKSIGFVAHRFGAGTSGARFAVVLDIDWKSRPIVLHMDLM